jgi:hypothetical protein
LFGHKTYFTSPFFLKNNLTTPHLSCEKNYKTKRFKYLI